MRITLSGDLGSGKSSVGKRLSEMLGIPYISAGALFREIGQISNMDALTTNLAAETNTDIDEQVDRRTRELNRTTPDFIIDSRMAWHFVTNAVRVFLSVRPETAAERVLADTSRKGEKYEDTQSALKMLRHRRDSELKRYRTLYNVDIEDPANYDLWIISDDAAVDDVCAVIRLFADGKTSAEELDSESAAGAASRSPAISRGLSRPQQDAEPVVLPLYTTRNFGLYSGDPAAARGGASKQAEADTVSIRRVGGAKIPSRSAGGREAQPDAGRPASLGRCRRRQLRLPPPPRVPPAEPELDQPIAEPPRGSLGIFRIDLHADARAAEALGGEQRRPDAEEGIEHRSLPPSRAA